MNNHVLLQVPFLRKSFLAVTTFVLCSFFMESVHMFAKSVRSLESLSTFFTCQHTSACMNLKMPCKVCFFEHISTFVTFLLLMRLNAVLGQFGSGFKCFSTHCTDILRHCLDLAKVRAELALYVPKKVRVVLLSKFSKQKLPSHKTVHFFTDIRFSLWGGVAPEVLWPTPTQVHQLCNPTT